MSTQTTTIPDEKAIGEQMSMLLGRRVAVKPTDQSIEPHLAGVFVDAAGTVVAACRADIQFAAFAGAALSMVPIGGAQECVKECELTEMLWDNFSEVLNVLGGLLGRTREGHVRLREVLSTDALATLADELGTDPNSVVLEGTVDGYGAGLIEMTVRNG